jgi:hypothetical protein
MADKPRLRLEVELGEQGLWYVTSLDVKGLLVTGQCVFEALSSVPSALVDLGTIAPPPARSGTERECDGEGLAICRL